MHAVLATECTGPINATNSQSLVKRRECAAVDWFESEYGVFVHANKMSEAVAALCEDRDDVPRPGFVPDGYFFVTHNRDDRPLRFLCLVEVEDSHGLTDNKMRRIENYLCYLDGEMNVALGCIVVIRRVGSCFTATAIIPNLGAILSCSDGPRWTNVAVLTALNPEFLIEVCT